jgi:hypothetical protein
MNVHLAVSMTALVTAAPADAYSAYGASLEAGLEGEIPGPHAHDDGHAAHPSSIPPWLRGPAHDAAAASEDHNSREASWSGDEYPDRHERWERSHHERDRHRRRGWRDAPSATLYMRVRL